MRIRPKAYFVAVLAFAIPAHADGPVLHEYLAPDVAEDLRMGATTQDGAMPAAIDTRRRRAGRAHGAAHELRGQSGCLRWQRDAGQYRCQLSYRSRYVPAGRGALRRSVHSGGHAVQALVRVRWPGRGLRAGGARQAAARTRDRRRSSTGRRSILWGLVRGHRARGAGAHSSVGPGTRVLVARAEPALRFELQHDGADNWFIVGDTRKRVRLVLELSIARRAFGSEFGEVSWSELARSVPALPPAARASASEVLRAVGISQAQRPAEAVRALVNYFRTFTPSDDAPRASSGSALYAELALSKKGVCRHRAYAFVVSALSLGIPARLVRNEAHAWVEVSDGLSWHRVDLGWRRQSPRLRAALE